MPGARFAVSPYVPQIGAGTSPAAVATATATDLAWAATELASFNSLQQLV